MTPEERKKREQDAHVKYIEDHLCDKDSKKPFVFISYKSDDWKIVLHDIVYSLVKDHGLNVYFDGSFDSHNPLWINQFRENMKSHNCKGVLAFLDDKYATSYATLLELMYSQTLLAGKLPVVPINLDALTGIDGEDGERHTELGRELYGDNTRNVNAKSEEESFVETFEELVDRKILVKSKYLYKEGKKLTKKICSEIVAELVARLEVNSNYYEEGKSLDGIVNTIKNTFEEGVFSKKISEPISAENDNESQSVASKDRPDEYRLPIADMAKVMDKTQKQVQKNTATKFKLKYKECELIGSGVGAAEYTIKIETENALKTLYAEMVKKVVDHYGEGYLAMFQDNHQATGLIRTYKDGGGHKPIPGWDGWYYYNNPNQKECLTFILRHLEMAGTNLTADDFEVRVVLDKAKTDPVCVEKFDEAYNEVIQK